MNIYLKNLSKVIDKGQIVINDKNDYSDEKFTTVKINLSFETVSQVYPERWGEAMSGRKREIEK